MPSFPQPQPQPRGSVLLLKGIRWVGSSLPREGMELLELGGADGVELPQAPLAVQVEDALGVVPLGRLNPGAMGDQLLAALCRPPAPVRLAHVGHGAVNRVLPLGGTLIADKAARPVRHRVEALGHGATPLIPLWLLLGRQHRRAELLVPIVHRRLPVIPAQPPAAPRLAAARVPRAPAVLIVAVEATAAAVAAAAAAVAATAAVATAAVADAAAVAVVDVALLTFIVAAAIIAIAIVAGDPVDPVAAAVGSPALVAAVVVAGADAALALLVALLVALLGRRLSRPATCRAPPVRAYA
jgi:hypothetical protein